MTDSCGDVRVTPKGLTRCQLYSSGAEAVEAALRLAKSKKFIPNGLMVILTLVTLALRNVRF